MTALIPGTHYLLPSVPNLDETYTLTCASCDEQVTRVAILSAYDEMEAHWLEAHKELIL